MPDNKMACREVQEALLEGFLSEGENARHPLDLKHHMEHCTTCGQFWERLGAVRSGFLENALYSSALRDKTLQRLAERERAPRIQRLPLIIVATLLSLSFSYALPCWVLSRLFLHWTSSMAAASAAALGTILLLGTVVTAVVAIALIERGYIDLANGEGTRISRGLPVTVKRNEFPAM